MIMYNKMMKNIRSVCGLLKSRVFTASFACLLAAPSFSCLLVLPFLVLTLSPNKQETASSSTAKPIGILLSFTDTTISWPWATMSKIILEHWYKLLRPFLRPEPSCWYHDGQCLDEGRVLLCLQPSEFTECYRSRDVNVFLTRTGDPLTWLD